MSIAKYIEKFSDKENDNVETKKLYPIIQSFLESIALPVNDGIVNVEPFEFRSRDGFAAFSHNRGGMDLVAFTTIGYLIGSGEHYKTAIEDKVTKRYNEIYETVKADNPTLDRDSLYEHVDRYTNDDYEGVAYRVRVQYNGNNQLTVWSGYDWDAPYYRWQGEELTEHKIKWKTKVELKKKLAALVKKIERVQ